VGSSVASGQYAPGDARKFFSLKRSRIRSFSLLWFCFAEAGQPEGEGSLVASGEYAPGDDRKFFSLEEKQNTVLLLLWVCFALEKFFLPVRHVQERSGTYGYNGRKQTS
jgi:hypothetical protein